MTYTLYALKHLILSLFLQRCDIYVNRVCALVDIQKDDQEARKFYIEASCMQYLASSFFVCWLRVYIALVRYTRVEILYVVSHAYFISLPNLNATL